MKNNLGKQLVYLGLVALILLSLLPTTHAKELEAGFFKQKASYEQVANEVVFHFELVNNHPAEQSLRFGSGQQFELVITDAKDEEVYRYSDGKAFTMALVYRDLKPGETLKWQDSWKLTDKIGNAVPPGEYKAEIKILATPDSLVRVSPANLFNIVLDFEVAAESIIKETASEVITALKEKNAEQLAAFVHPEKGVRFTPYTYVSLDNDLVFDQKRIENFFVDETKYLWGQYDGTGRDIHLTPQEYYAEFIYTHDFINAEQIGYNEVLSSGNMLENQFEVYENPIVVEYYFSGFNPDYAGLDWRSLRLVFEPYLASWKLVGIIYNQWTI